MRANWGHAPLKNSCPVGFGIGSLNLVPKQICHIIISPKTILDERETKWSYRHAQGQGTCLIWILSTHTCTRRVSTCTALVLEQRYVVGGRGQLQGETREAGSVTGKLDCGWGRD